MANKAVMQAWVDALRSGDYTQAKGALRRKGGGVGGGHCCLGVLTEIAIKHPELGSVALPADLAWHRASDEWATADSLGWTNNAGNVRRESAMPPEEVRAWCGLIDWTVARANTTVGDDDEYMTAVDDASRVPFSYLNDADVATFPEIADIIEKEYIGA